MADTRLQNGGVRPGPAAPRSREGVHEYAHLTPLFKELHDLSPDDPRRAALRAELVTGYLPVAQHIARRFAGRGEPEDDLVQAGTLGLIGAVDRFDPHRGLDFLSFAVPTITGEIRRHFRDHTWAMRVPRRLEEHPEHDDRRDRAARPGAGSPPRPSEIAARLGVPIEDVVDGLSAQHAYRNDSLDQLSQAGDASLAKGAGSIDESLAGVEDRETLAPLLDALPERERRSSSCASSATARTSQIAEVIGVSQMHISRLLDRTLRELRERFNR